jgi:hypothetical protein
MDANDCRMKAPRLETCAVALACITIKSAIVGPRQPHAAQIAARSFPRYDAADKKSFVSQAAVAEQNRRFFPLTFPALSRIVMA